MIPTAAIDRFAKIVDSEKQMVVRNAPSMGGADRKRGVGVERREHALVKRPPAIATSFGLNCPLLRADSFGYPP